MIKTILFDLDNTLSRIKMGGELFRGLFLQKYTEVVSLGTGIPPEAINYHSLRIIKDIKEHPPLTKTISEVFFKRLSEILDIDIDLLMQLTQEFYTKKMLELKKYYEPAPQLHKVISKLKEMKINIAIATDPVTRKIGVIQRLKWIGLADFPFCFISSADTMHAAKPHKAFFDEILENCNSTPNESMMVGDTYLEDIYASKTAGLIVVFIDHNKGIDASEWKVKPDFIIHKLSDIPKIVKNQITNENV